MALCKVGHRCPRGDSEEDSLLGFSICQRYGDKLRYATLYDSSLRLALYSAYTFKKSDGQRRMDTPWMYEAQLVSADKSGDMRVLPSSGETDQLLEESQAVLADYFDAVVYERGPLNPDQHQADNQDKAATHTLTKVVPQITELLEDPWATYIDMVRRRLNNFCRGAAFVVTGVTVSGATIQRGGEECMAVPKHLWSAYCCPRFDRNSPYEVRYMFPTYAAYALNEIVGHSVTEVPLKALETFLKNQTDMDKNLATDKGSSNMEPFPQSFFMPKNFKDTQALLEDYVDVVQYERGQLIPDEHQADPLDKAATYTLTNVVPLLREFSFGPWSTQVEVTCKHLNNYCHGKAYLITGVTTSGNMITKTIPELIWTAYCCTDYDHNAPYSERYKFPAFGAYGLNDRVNHHIVEVPIKNLERFLKGKMEVDKNFQIFYND